MASSLKKSLVSKVLQVLLAKLIAYQDLSNRHKIAASAVCDLSDHNAMFDVVKAFLKAERISKEIRILSTQ